MKRAVVIGAGVGGLATAIRLRSAGLEVHILEKNAQPGGRCGLLELDGFRFDIGPTIVLLKPVFEELFASAGRKLSDYLDFVACDPNYRIHFADGESVRFSANLREMQRELERLEPGSFGGYLRYLEHGRRAMQASLSRFVTKNFDSVTQFATPGNLAEVLRTGAHRNLWGLTGRHFRDERLRIALSFQTMYLGISPHQAPGIYSLLPYTELAEGIWFPKGGVYAIPLALEKLARELGVTFEYGANVQRIVTEGRRATGVRLADGSVREADAVIANADLPYVYRELLPEAPFPRASKLRYTSSAFMFYLGLDRQVPALEHHNVFLASDFAKNFDDIFGKREVPQEPSFYVNVANRTDPALAPAGRDGLYVLVPVPHQREGLDWKAAAPRLRDAIFDRLRDAGVGELRPHVAVERTFTPDDWQQSFNLEKGAAFGLSHDFFQVGAFRPRNQDATFPNVYFVGASTQPGTGLPMVLMGAQLCAERVLGSGAGELAA